MRGPIAVLLAVAFFSIFAALLILFLIIRDTRKVKVLSPPVVVAPVPCDDNPSMNSSYNPSNNSSYNSSTNSSYNSSSTQPNSSLPPRPDFSLLPPGSVNIQSVPNTNSTALLRGGYVDVTISSASGQTINLEIPPNSANVTNTTIRVRNIGISGDVIFTPRPGVTLEPLSDSRVSPQTIGFFTAVALNSYVRN